MQQKINLKPDDILQKRFNVDFKGYSGEEVDSYLDIILDDYNAFNANIKELGTILSEYEQKIEALQQENEELKAQLARNKNGSEIKSFNQLDILKRLARLEAEVFKK